MAGVSKALEEWRRKQPRGAIMKPSTFEEIVQENMAKGYSRERAEKIAGAAYWETARRKYKKTLLNS